MTASQDRQIDPGGGDMKKKRGRVFHIVTFPIVLGCLAFMFLGEVADEILWKLG